MIAFTKLSEMSFKRITSFMLAAVICVFLALPANTEAGIWDDKEGGNIDTVVKRVKSIKENVDNLVKTIKDGKDTITDGKIKQMIDDMKAMLQAAVNRPQDGINEFIAEGNCEANDSTPCGLFKSNLLLVLQRIEDINNQLLSMHNIPSLDLQVEDPGLGDLISKIPGRILFPLYNVMTKTQFLNGGLIDILEEIPTRLEEIRPILLSEDPIFPPSISTSSASSFTTSGITSSAFSNTVPTPSPLCLLIANRPRLLNITAIWLNTAGTINQILGAILKAMSKTAIVGPKEVDAGIHGYVHGTLATDHLGGFGDIASIFGTVLSALGNTVSGKINSCGVEFRQIEILRGQKEILCAMKNNNLLECTEFVGNGFDNHGVGGGQGGGGKP